MNLHVRHFWFVVTVVISIAFVHAVDTIVFKQLKDQHFIQIFVDLILSHPLKNYLAIKKIGIWNQIVAFFLNCQLIDVECLGPFKMFYRQKRCRNRMFRFEIGCFLWLENNCKSQNSVFSLSRSCAIVHTFTLAATRVGHWVKFHPIF